MGKRAGIFPKWVHFHDRVAEILSIGYTGGGVAKPETGRERFSLQETAFDQERGGVFSTQRALAQRRQPRLRPLGVRRAVSVQKQARRGLRVGQQGEGNDIAISHAMALPVSPPPPSQRNWAGDFFPKRRIPSLPFGIYTSQSSTPLIDPTFPTASDWMPNGDIPTHRIFA